MPLPLPLPKPLLPLPLLNPPLLLPIPNSPLLLLRPAHAPPVLYYFDHLLENFYLHSSPWGQTKLPRPQGTGKSCENKYNHHRRNFDQESVIVKVGVYEQ